MAPQYISSQMLFPQHYADTLPISSDVSVPSPFAWWLPQPLGHCGSGTLTPKVKSQQRHELPLCFLGMLTFGTQQAKQLHAWSGHMEVFWLTVSPEFIWEPASTPEVWVSGSIISFLGLDCIPPFPAPLPQLLIIIGIPGAFP